MIGWHHRLNEHEFEQTLGYSGGQKAWHATVHGTAESDTTQRQNNTMTYVCMYVCMYANDCTKDYNIIP